MTGPQNPLAGRCCRAVSFMLWLTLLAFQAGTGHPAQAQNEGLSAQARQFVDSLGRDAIAIMASKSESQMQRVERYRTLLHRDFDLQTISRFVLGRYWGVSTPVQRQEYLKQFEEMVVHTYARQFDSYDGQTFRVLSGRPEGDHDIIVASEILQPDGPAIHVEWRVRPRNGHPAIIDVAIDGVSMSVTQRQEFASVIQAKGGDIDAFLQALRDKNATLATP